MSIIIPNLGLHLLTDSELVEFADDKVSKINAEAAFAAVIPTTVDVDAKKVDFLNAITAANDGTVADTQFKEDTRAELEAMLTLQAQNCAEIAAGSLALYERSGYRARDTRGTPTGPLEQVSGFHLEFGDNEGELKAGWNAIEDAQNFSVQVFTDVDNPQGTLIKEFIKSKIGRKLTVLDGLPTGQKVAARVRANGGSTGQGPWSDIAIKRVP